MQRVYKFPGLTLAALYPNIKLFNRPVELGPMTEYISTEANGAPLAEDLQGLADLIDQAAKTRTGDSVALLALLRLLEQRHREVCDTLFREALPENRHGLYSLLKDIEVNGGWPYIQRMKLRSLFDNWAAVDEAADGTLENEQRY
ncbi:MAG: hypothetical protein ACFCVD_20420 [Nodosilinea sp.]